MKSSYDSRNDQTNSLYNSSLNRYNGNHKSQDSNTSVSSSHVSNSSKIAGSDSRYESPQIMLIICFNL
jgi:hypothetical protein